MTRRERKADVLIAGGGFAGLALAIALRQGSGDAFSVTVADPALGAQRSGDPRASAIAAAARRLFETIGVWDAVAADAQPILDMVVTDSKLDDAVRPTFLTFDGEVEPGEPFAHMIENAAADRRAARRRRSADGVELRADCGRRISTHDAGAHRRATLADGATLSARLLVAADGARSAIREHAGIATHRLGLRPVRHRHHGRA